MKSEEKQDSLKINEETFSNQENASDLRELFLFEEYDLTESELRRLVKVDLIKIGQMLTDLKPNHQQKESLQSDLDLIFGFLSLKKKQYLVKYYFETDNYGQPYSYKNLAQEENLSRDTVRTALRTAITDLIPRLPFFKTLIQEKELSDYQRTYLKTKPIWRQKIKHYKKDIIYDQNKQRDLVIRAQAGDKAAKDEMIMINLRLVDYFVRHYRDNKVAPEDLRQEGVLGLMRAIEKFEPDRGYRFSTYAIYWIKQKMNQLIKNEPQTIRKPNHWYQDLSCITKIHSFLLAELNREPSVEEIAQMSGMSVIRIKNILNVKENMMSLDNLDQLEEDDVFGDSIIDTDFLFFEEEIIKRVDSKALNLILNKILSHKEKTIIQMRFGFLENKIYSLEYIGEKFNLSRERIRQIQNIALEKLSHHLTNF